MSVSSPLVHEHERRFKVCTLPCALAYMSIDFHTIDLIRAETGFRAHVAPVRKALSRLA